MVSAAFAWISMQWTRCGLAQVDHRTHFQGSPTYLFDKCSPSTCYGQTCLGSGGQNETLVLMSGCALWVGRTGRISSTAGVVG